MGFLFNLLIGVLLNIVAYLIMPKPKAAKPPAVKDMDNPKAESGKPIPVIWGTMTLKGLNIIWYGNKSKKIYEVSMGGGKK